jgi:hypothetical protein
VIETDIRQSPAVPGFFYCVILIDEIISSECAAVMREISNPAVDPRDANLQHLKHRGCARAKCEKAACHAV